MSLLRDMKLMLRDRISLPRDKSVDLTWDLSCRATLFECFRHNHLSLWQVPMIWCDKPDLLLFKSIVGTSDLLSKHALGILLSQLNTLVFQAVQECGVSKQSHHEKCEHISSNVTKTNQSSADPIFRSSLEREENLADKYPPKFSVYHRKISTFIKKQNPMAYQSSNKCLIQLIKRIQKYYFNFY